MTNLPLHTRSNGKNSAFALQELWSSRKALFLWKLEVLWSIKDGMWDKADPSCTLMEGQGHWSYHSWHQPPEGSRLPPLPLPKPDPRLTLFNGPTHFLGVGGEVEVGVIGLEVTDGAVPSRHAEPLDEQI